MRREVRVRAQGRQRRRWRESDGDAWRNQEKDGLWLLDTSTPTARPQRVGVVENDTRLIQRTGQKRSGGEPNVRQGKQQDKRKLLHGLLDG